MVAGFFQADHTSNRVDLTQVENPIKEGRLDEAERTCKELMTRYPDQIDGIERLAAVYEARIMGL
jgi:hypothetical protein